MVKSEAMVEFTVKIRHVLKLPLFILESPHKYRTYIHRLEVAIPESSPT